MEAEYIQRDINSWSYEKLLSFVEEAELDIEKKDHLIEVLTRENAQLVARLKQSVKSAVSEHESEDSDLDFLSLGELELEGKFSFF